MTKIVNRDREFACPAALPDWLKEFANKELRGASPFEEIKNLFKQKDDTDAVEARVKELQERVGLDKVAFGEEDKIIGGKAEGQPDEKYDEKQLEMGVKIEMEHTPDKEIAKEITKDHLEESKDFKNNKGAKYYDKLEKMEKTIKEELAASDGFSLSIRDSDDRDVFEKHEGIKKHIDNVCESRKGQIDAPALMVIIRSRPEKLTDKEQKEVKEYIEKKIKETREKPDFDKDDDIIGKNEVIMFTVNEEDDGNKDVFSNPPQI